MLSPATAPLLRCRALVLQKHKGTDESKHLGTGMRICGFEKDSLNLQQLRAARSLSGWIRNTKVWDRERRKVLESPEQLREAAAAEIGTR